MRKLFSCRFCTENPFAKLLGWGEEESEEEFVEPHEDLSKFQPRDPILVDETTTLWNNYVHPRALELQNTRAINVNELIGQNCGKPKKLFSRNSQMY